jgi:hypothetical protein
MFRNATCFPPSPLDSEAKSRRRLVASTKIKASRLTQAAFRISRDREDHMMVDRHCRAQLRRTTAQAGSALRIDPAIGINYLRAGRRCIGTGCNRPADDRTAYHGPTRRPASDAGVTHRRQRPSNPCLGRRDEATVDGPLAAPEQWSGETDSGCDEQDRFAR